MGIPWWSSGLDVVLSLPKAQVQSLVGELRYGKPRGMDKKNKKQNHGQGSEPESPGVTV